MSEFFAMGGHGYYIWMSYGVAALCMAAEVVTLLFGRAAAMQRLRRLARAEALKATAGDE
jgi:heme exporter protein D